VVELGRHLPDVAAMAQGVSALLKAGQPPTPAPSVSSLLRREWTSTAAGLPKPLVVTMRTACEPRWFLTALVRFSVRECDASFAVFLPLTPDRAIMGKPRFSRRYKGGSDGHECAHT
jgi:hypothetical protein